MKERLFAELKLYFPTASKHVVNYAESGLGLLLCKMDNDDSILFDSVDNSIRRLPANSDDMCEEECKREFGIRLRRLMLIRGISQAELSEKTGLSQPQLSNYMTGKNMPSFYSVDRIAKALKCSTDDLRYKD